MIKAGKGATKKKPPPKPASFGNEFEKALYEKPAFKALYEQMKAARLQNEINLIIEYMNNPRNAKVRYGGTAKYDETVKAGRKPGLLLEKKHGLADKLVLSKVRDIFGGNVKLALTGAAPIDPEIIRFFHAAGVPVYEAWGMTETSPIASVAVVRSGLADRSEDELADLRASQGPAVLGVDLRIVDQATGEPAPWDGESRGELQAAGPWITATYYDDERSAESFTEDGWLKTGDVAVMTPEGKASRPTCRPWIPAGMEGARTPCRLRSPPCRITRMCLVPPRGTSSQTSSGTSATAAGTCPMRSRARISGSPTGSTG
jgi:hypothetical protein